MKKIARKIAKKSALMVIALAALSAVDASAESQWWKGNTHTHTWWSDGDSPPEVVADWYKEHGYQFLVLSDHNIMQQGEKWYSITNSKRNAEQVQAAYQTYHKLFPTGWIEEREVNGDKQVKLKTLDEFRSLYEQPNRFIFVKGEEISDRFRAHPIHMNGVNTVKKIEPQAGNSVADAIQNNIDAVRRQSEQFGQPMFVHLNHPNFYYAQTAEDFFYLDYAPGEGYFEMYNGHPHVNNYGDALHDSAERIWDIVLAKRLGELHRSVLYGVAVDDAHEYTRWGVGETNPGRGWIMVRSEWLTPNKIVEAIKRGDYYNSTGVTLKKLAISDNRIDLEIDAERGVDYRVEFVGTRRGVDLEPEMSVVPHDHMGVTDHEHKAIKRYSAEIGQLLKVVEGRKASYVATGDEIYVRARIISSKAKHNPFAEGDVEMAWTQPLVVAAP
ncbi:hypothetical protein [Halioxenophilus sp. WMMB6]|uniref:PHP domain-containing protein n=1 Tax=Halioxenophilus sp. WMMB6 TaxID=3073815 RepID=UPI00295E488F|nr:hypothetical protein [Halioxenophilus sp. WMMB6]